LPDRSGRLEIFVEDGCIWLTKVSSAHGVILCRGGRHQTAGNGKVMIRALEPSRIRIRGDVSSISALHLAA
jgi:hypothetical protein